MIKAIIEAGIPIDHVAGVSIGSFIGALYRYLIRELKDTSFKNISLLFLCQLFFSVERNLTEVTVKARDFSVCIGIIWRLLMDLTYPFISYFAGNRFNAVIEKYFKDFDILVRFSNYNLLTSLFRFDQKLKASTLIEKIFEGLTTI